MSVSIRMPELQNRGGVLRRIAPSDQTALFWIMGLMVVQTCCQMGLMFEFLAPFRVVFRTGSYSVAVLAFFVARSPGVKKHHPAFWAGVFCLGLLALQFLNPTTNTVLSAIATLFLNIAILSPLFWVPRLNVSTRVLRSVCLYLWLFHSLSSIFGVLQVYFPGSYQPAMSNAIKNDQYNGDQLKVTLASGDNVYRPMGLTDVPGGAAMAGMYAFLFGLGILSIARSIPLMVGGFLSLPIGLFCIYLSQVRSVLILILIVAVAFALILAATRRYGAAVRVAFVLPIVMAAGFIWALALGGDATQKRFETLIEENPAELYNKSRGQFLNETFENLLPDYPFGAGLGRYGMMQGYFGDPTLADSFPIWVEIQWTAWVVDGGVLLVSGYVILLGIAVLTTGRIAFRSPNYELAGWAKLILAYDLSMMALTFSYVPFAAQSGMEFWLINAIIFAADQTDRARVRRRA